MGTQMTIRFKVIASLALLFTVLCIAAIFIQLRVVMPSFAQLERTTARTAMRRVRFAISRDLQALQVDATDWANWGEAYAFVQGRNPNFVKMNFTRTAINQIQIDTIVIVDLSGRILAWTGDVIHTNLSLRGSLADGSSLPANFPWRKLLGSKQSVHGLVKTNLGPMMIAGSPILNGTGRGRPIGMVIIGRLLTPARLRDLGIRTQSNLLSVNEPVAPKSEIVHDTKRYIRVYRSFKDIYQQPLMTLRVKVPRNIEASGRTAIRYASMSIMAVAIVVLILLVILLNRLVLAPLTRMMRHAVAVGENPDLRARLNCTTQDEFGQLAREFDRMVEKLADARRQLVDQSFHAGLAEAAKGVLHNLGNALTSLGVRATVLERRVHDVPITDLGRAAAELAGGEVEPERRAALTELIDLGCRRAASLLDESTVDIGVIQRQAATMRSALTEHMRSSASAEPVIEAVNLPELITQSLEIVPEASRERLQVDTDASVSRVGTVRLVRTVLRLVLQNVIINASEAVRDAGKDSGSLRLFAERLRVTEGEQLHIFAQDDGIGIAAENLERVFEKGYSTKSRETNYGIGLHWCANAIQSLGGRIWATSDGPGLGAAVHLILPLDVSRPGRA
jgi:two-component system, NtrC family, sensor kinase